MATAAAMRSGPTTRQTWILSLRARLIASHIFVILLALSLVLLISGAYLRRYELKAERERIEQLAGVVAISTTFNFLDRGIQRPIVTEQRIEAIDAQAQEMNVRLLVFDRDGTVLYDSNPTDSLTGITFSDYVSPIRRLLQSVTEQADVKKVWVQPDSKQNPLPGEQVLLAASVRNKPRTVVGMVAPPRRYPLLATFLPRLMIVAAVSLAVASVAGYLLSRRIAAPIGKLTSAANLMAAGNLKQRVSGESSDEIGTLVASFNTMSQRVSETAKSQRDLLANVAHELRTPLTSVQGYAQALREGVIDNEEEQLRALATIGNESERMGRLIGQLLDLARLESGQSTLLVRSVAVEPLMQRVADRFRPEAMRNGLTMEVIGGGNLTVTGDEDRMTQILSNLVDNAIRHTPKGGRVRLEAGTDAELGVRFTVADTGSGIPQERLSKIFERFERGDLGRRDRSGFGLGLAIVRELVVLHGGKIAVASEIGAGTTFAVDFPVAGPTMNTSLGVVAPA
jgi:signal transduction histidine kinase